MRLHPAAANLERRRGRSPLSRAEVSLTIRDFVVAAFGIALTTLVPSSASAQLHLSPLISDGMVLQRDAAVPIWGSADRGDTIVVTLAGGTYRTVADTSGRWMVTLPPRSAGGPYEMTVA